MYNPNKKLPTITPKYKPYKNVKPWLPNGISNSYSVLKNNIVSDIQEVKQNEILDYLTKDMDYYQAEMYKSLAVSASESRIDKEKKEKILAENGKQDLKLLIGEIYAIGVRTQKNRAKFSTDEAYNEWAKDKPEGDIKSLLEKYVSKIDNVYNPPPKIEPLRNRGNYSTSHFNEIWNKSFNDTKYILGCDPALGTGSRNVVTYKHGVIQNVNYAADMIQNYWKNLK